MEHIWLQAALWLGLAIVAAAVASAIRLPSAVCEIVAGALAPILLNAIAGRGLMNTGAPWVVFLSGAGALVLAFLAGSELEPEHLRAHWRESLAIGVLAFLFAFVAVGSTAHVLLGWSWPASVLAGTALSTACVSIVYTILLDQGLTHTRLGQALLAASYLNNLFSALALGAMLAPFTGRTLALLAVTAALVFAAPAVSARFLGRFRSRVSQADTRYVLFLLFGFGGLAVWADCELILPAYLLGAVLAGQVGRNAALVRNLQALAFGILTPFYFLRAGAQVSIAALAAAPLVAGLLLSAKLAAKLGGIMPALRLLSYSRKEAGYYTLMISPGLGLGTIAALEGMTHGLINQAQYSHIVAAIAASAVIPTAIATAWFAPRHLAVVAEAPAALQAKPRSVAMQ